MFARSINVSERTPIAKKSRLSRRAEPEKPVQRAYPNSLSERESFILKVGIDAGSLAAECVRNSAEKVRSYLYPKILEFDVGNIEMLCSI